MVVIYCIEDINDYKYIGSTNQGIKIRLSQHQCELRRSSNTSSSKLNLYNCIIYPLEDCEEDMRKERERYWINKIECVNTQKLNGRDIEKIRKRMREYGRLRRLHNNELVKKQKRESYHRMKKLRLVFPDS
jgi:hypothetical protein